MPLSSKRLRAAKLLHQNMLTAFAKPTHLASSEGLEYHDSDNDSDDLEMGVKSSNESEIQGTEILQYLYSIFLSLYLCLKEKRENKHKNIRNRMPVYSGNLQTSMWQKCTSLKHAAEKCTTLNTFLVKKVCPFSVKQ
jgi:hypothetical protein